MQLGLMILLALSGAAEPTVSADLARIDELQQNRDQPVALAEEKWLVERALAKAPNDYGVLWRAARLHFWLGDDPDLAVAARSELGKKGWDLAERAVAANPDHVAGHYWAAVNMGNYVLGLGAFRAMTMGLDGKFCARMERAGQLDPTYLWGAIDSVWGRYYDRLPWPKRDAKKSDEHLRRALQINAHSLRTRVFLADVLLREGNAQEAKRLLDEVAAAQPGKYDAPEERRSKILGARLLPKVLEELK